MLTKRMIVRDINLINVKYENTWMELCISRNGDKIYLKV